MEDSTVLKENLNVHSIKTTNKRKSTITIKDLNIKVASNDYINKVRIHAYNYTL